MGTPPAQRALGRSGLIAVILASAASAHVISMSSGEVTVTGNHLRYVLRMPDYEIQKLQHPEQSLLDHITFTNAGETARRASQECHHDPSSVNVICTAAYDFSRPVENLGVECSFFDVTVANHIHVLHAERDGKTDRAILDSGFSSATLTFRPPTHREMNTEQFLGGFMRVASNGSQLLMLAALALGARSRRELLLMIGAFLAAQIAAAQALPHSAWQPSPRFAKEVAAVALAWLAVEMFFLPDAAGRWLIAMIFGAFSGLYLSAFLTEAQYPPASVLSGSAAAVILLVAIFGAAARALSGVAMRRAAAVALFGTGCVWFATRLTG